MHGGTWQFGAELQDLVGWSTAAAYVLTSIVCARLAFGSSRSAALGQEPGWWSLSLLMVALGVNKQLNFQTIILHAGRAVAKWGYWYDCRRRLQVAFVAGLALAAGVFGWRVLQSHWNLTNIELM